MHGHVRTGGAAPRRWRGGRPLAMALVAALALVALAPTLATLASQLLQSGGPSPAQGHAEVIAHGVAPMPAAQVAWQVEVETAELQENAAIDPWAIGFVHVDEGAVVVNDLSYGTQTRVAAGEGAFVPQGVDQQRASLSGGSVGYYDITLVPSSNGFTGPNGNVDIDLVRDVFEANEDGELAGGNYPVLLLATAGEIEVELGDGTTASLQAGEADVFSGDLEIAAIGTGGASYVAAVIGPDVPAPPTPPPPPPATIALDVAICPAGYEGDDFATDCTEPGADIVFNLFVGDEFDPDADPAVDGETDADGELTFTQLLPGDFVLAADIPGDFASSVAFCEDADDEDVTLEGGEGEVGNTNAVALAVEAGAEIGCAWFIVPVDQGGPASLTVTTRLCPEGMRPETIVGDFCDLLPRGEGGAVEGPAYNYTLAGGEVSLTLDEAIEVNPGTFTFENLEFGDYTLTVDSRPTGTDAFLVPGAECDPAAFVCTFTIAEADADLNLIVYYFVPEGSAPSPSPSPSPSPAPVDTDGDGLSDDEEIGLGTDPTVADTDADGLSDGDEINTYGTSPFDVDSDDDGVTDGAEVEAGTDPADPASV